MRLALFTLAASAAAASSLAIAAAPAPSPLPPAPPAGAGLPNGQCFRGTDIRNHTVADDRTLLLSVQSRGAYRITMGGACLAGIQPNNPIVTRQASASNLICRPIDLDVGVLKGGIESPCIVKSIARLTPAEVAALPRKLVP